MPCPAIIAQLAHIGKIPVEEWLPFVVPVLVLFVLGRRREQRRRREVAVIPQTSAGLDPAVVQQILAGWQEAEFNDVRPAHLPLLYPPGPDGLSVAELAGKTSYELGTVQKLLEGLEESDYLCLNVDPISDGFDVSLTLKGYGLVDATEDCLLAALREHPLARNEPG